MRFKKGMSIGMVFIFIVAILTFALIVIFGYDKISDFLETGEEVEFFQFKSDLEISVKGIYTEYESVRMAEFNLPMKYEEICFVNLEKAYPEECDFDIYGCDVWKEANGDWLGADENVFLDPPGQVQIKIYKIELGSEGELGGLCVPITKGRFSLRLEGRGDRTRISEAK